MLAFLGLLVAMVMVAGLTGLLRRYALARAMMDVPNARSSHEVPTPRGGGLAIALVVVAGLAMLGAAGAVAPGVMLALGGAGLLVALVGWWDDRGEVPPLWRLLAHFVAAGWGLAWLGGLPPLPVFGVVLDLGWFGHALALVYLVWLLNLYNFMDGIDGIAGIEAVTAGLGVAVLMAWLLPGADWLLPALLVAATLGFLPWNFPRARIFMGDGGAGFLGITLGLLSIQAAWVAPEFFWVWLVMLALFVVDATYTLVRRGMRGERVHVAHRAHAYQHAARLAGSHAPVSLGVGLINLLWLLPVAALVSQGHLDGALGALIGSVPLLAGAVWFRAGEPEQPD